MLHAVEEPTDVRVHDPTPTEGHATFSQGSESAMRAEPRTEPVRGSVKVPFVDSREEHDHRPLDNLVLERGDADRPLAAARLRDPHATDWGSYILLAPQPFVKISEVGVQILRIRLAGLAVDACRPILAGEPRCPSHHLRLSLTI